MFKFCLTFLFSCVCVSTVLAQTIAITSDGKKVVLKDDKTWEYLTDKTPENKPSETSGKIAGVDARELAKFIASIKSKLDKSEFETEEQYLRRLELVFVETKFNDKPIEETVFVVEAPLEYNAEKQEFSAYVDRTSSSYVTIDLVERKDAYFSRLLLEKLSFKLSPEKAQKDKPNLRLAIYAIPVNYKDYTNTLEVIPFKYVFFNKETNEVYLEQVRAEETSDSKSGLSPSSGSNGPVQVRGYFRKDGKYVKPYTRSRPKN